VPAIDTIAGPGCGVFLWTELSGGFNGELTTVLRGRPRLRLAGGVARGAAAAAGGRPRRRRGADADAVEGRGGEFSPVFGDFSPAVASLVVPSGFAGAVVVLVISIF
jgi:hypothetical protein